MSNPAIIDSMYSDFTALVDYLGAANEISLRNLVDNNFKKTLSLSAASYFEDQIRNIILKLVQQETNDNPVITSFVESQAVTRKYHTYFDWDKSNANKFFSMFGPDFKTSASDDVKTNNDLQDSIKAFLELGNIRNELAHLNFANFPLDKTSSEVYELYRKATMFVSYISEKLNNFEKNEN